MLFLTLAIQIQLTTQGDNITLVAAANHFGVNIIVVCPGQAEHEIPCQRKDKKIMDTWILLHRPEKNQGTWFWSLRHDTQSLSCQETVSTI